MAQLPAGIDFETISLVAGSIVVFVGGTVGGVRLGFKKVREGADEGTKIVGGTIMSSVEIAMLSERLREDTEATRDNTEATRELGHQIERLRDKM